MSWASQQVEIEDVERHTWGCLAQQWRSNGAAIQPFIQLVFQHLETPQPSECPQVIAK